MKKIDFSEEKYEFIGNTYVIPRSSSSYEFFHSEFQGLPHDLEGNILLNYERKVSRREIIKDILLSIKNYFTAEEKCIGIPIGSPEHTFFLSEYSHQFSEDTRHNIIVPGEEYSKIRVKK